MRTIYLSTFIFLIFSVTLINGQNVAAVSNNTQNIAVKAQDNPDGFAPAKGYLLGPGDEIAGKVLGEMEYDFVATINEDGFVEVPFSKTPVLAKCKTERELRV